LDIKIPLSDSAAHVLQANIRAGEKVWLEVAQLEVWLRVQEDASVSPFRIRLEDRMFGNQKIKSNLFMTGVESTKFE
jgi:hypothetical protein